MTKRRRIVQADKIIQNVINVFCLLMFLQLKGYYSTTNNPVLLYSTASDIRVANTSKLGKINVIIKGLEQGSAVDFLHKKNTICWSDQTAELIQCMEYNDTHSGEKIRIVSEGIITPTGIALDWYTNKMYWTDGETNKIEVICIENKYRKVLFWSDVDLARAIALVPTEGLMFWTDWGEIPKIERAGMNGDPATRKVIVKDNIFWPNGITVDYNNNLIYWVDTKLQFVDVMGFNGENRKRVVKDGLKHPYALAYFDNKLYWTDWKKWSIYTYDIAANSSLKEIIKSDHVPVDIKVYDESRQVIPNGEYPCKNNEKCSHLCLLAPNSPGYVCSCPTGVKLREGSNTTCYNGPQSLLLVAQRSIISKISLDSPDYTPYSLPLKDLKRALTVDFDPKTEYIYWADSMSKTISRARLDGSDQSIVIHCSGVPDSIAIDPLARNIYWTDPISDTITVARLDGQARKVIIHDELYDPRAIALHPVAGWMFWSDWNEKKPKIERANLDGTGRVLLVSEKLIWPNGIALDTEKNKLYWGDARTHKIEVCNMDGSGRRELHGSDILHIFGLTLLGDNLYWTDMQRRTLDRINKETGSSRQSVVEQMANMMGVRAVRLGPLASRNPCSAEHVCSHLCFNRPDTHVCACPIGLELGSDRKTCIEPEAFLLYSRKNIIGLISIDNENNDAVLPIKELKEVSALAVDVSGSKLYWSDSKTKTINRCNINGSNMEKILEFMGLVEGVAIDWSAQNIYWTDTAAHRIEVARLDGSSRRAIMWQGLKKPKSIALDPRKGYMYWSELGSKTIKRATMDGSSPIVLFEQVVKVHALAIDYEKRAIYWAALDSMVIEYAFLNGTGRKVLVDNIPMPYALALYNDRVFWGDWNTGLVEVAKKSDGSSRRTIHTQLDYISDLKVYHRGRDNLSNQCGVDNGGCSHLCLPLTNNDYRCACPTHYRLNRDNLTCSEPEEFLLYAQKNAVGRLLAANSECSDAFIPLTGLRNVKAIEYDPISRHLYWMDEENHSIRRVPISYSATSAVTDSTNVVSDLSRPFHMALDVLGRTLYWTCLNTDSINATSIENNSSSGVIIRGDNMMPRYLAFHQTKRLLFWSDAGLGGIFRSLVDGSERAQLVRVDNVTALALDMGGASALYWAVGRQIHAVDIDGSNRRVIWQGGAVGALAAYGGALYLGGERVPSRLPLHRRDAPATPLAHVQRILSAVSVHRVPRDHPCYGACGGAPATCGRDGVCGCGLSCSARRHCDPDHFLCGRDNGPTTNSVQCIPMEWKCDGQRDCLDGSDESQCDSCAGLHCADGSCAPALGGCLTGAYCTHALPDAFRCDDRLCLPAGLLCDGRSHCEDESDEAPAACGYVHKDQMVSVGASGQSHALVVCGSVVGAAVVVAALWAGVRRYSRAGRHQPHQRTLALNKPATRPRTDAPSSDSFLRLSAMGTASGCGSGSGSGSGSGWGSDSLCGRYPRPTANPPPSPATASGGRRRAYRNYRASNRPPPPTPASTDANESENEHARAPPPSPAPLLY
ncbi:low-density lipoprotein receptor-related protein 6 [Danaus plexippus]|uniref:low-density lipoprotein receptor-related protein 6 n=1 Tax=Danaus plexippus TaxID=13037 RepID=UPI002AB1414D|nr:low-density lipoprotein receptor-related protein 6 [Danaus plexippus]